MKNDTIMVVVNQETPNQDLENRLETIRSIPAQVNVIIAGEIPQLPTYALGVPPYGTIDVPPEWQASMLRFKASLKAQQEEIEALLQKHGMSGGVSIVAAEPMQLSHAIGRQAMLCDIALISEELRGQDVLFRQITQGILFHSPTGIMLNTAPQSQFHKPERVFVAWNAELHAARAVRQALPFLRAANEVTIGIVDPVMRETRDGEDPGVDVARWLTHHGCKVTVSQIPSGGKDVGQCIVDHAKGTGADLIVMGAYSHSRAREAVFGGTTRTLIQQTAHPVFLAH